MASLRGASYHVVCHDCEHERLIPDRDAARSLADDHAEHTGHRVEFARVG
ncbi:MAG: hypothetical protein ABEJ34_03930 [Haloferacaceae archaeon]